MRANSKVHRHLFCAFASGFLVARGTLSCGRTYQFGARGLLIFLCKPMASNGSCAHRVQSRLRLICPHLPYLLANPGAEAYCGRCWDGGVLAGPPTPRYIAELARLYAELERAVTPQVWTFVKWTVPTARSRCFLVWSDSGESR